MESWGSLFRGGACKSQSGASPPSSPQLCNCPDDLTSGALAGTAGGPSIFGTQPTDSGTPSGIQIVGLLFQYQGPNSYIDSDGNPALLFPNADADATIFANAWMLQVINGNGDPMQGNFTATENVNSIDGNVVPLVNSNYTWTTNFNGQFVDNIMLAPSNLSAIAFNTTIQTFTINGVNVPTNITQGSLYQPGMGLVYGNPSYIEP